MKLVKRNEINMFDLNYYVVKNGLYLCYDFRWTDKLIWALRFPNEEMAEYYANLRRAYTEAIPTDVVAERLKKEVNPTVELAIKQFAYGLKHRN